MPKRYAHSKSQREGNAEAYTHLSIREPEKARSIDDAYCRYGSKSHGLEEYHRQKTSGGVAFGKQARKEHLES